MKLLTKLFVIGLLILGIFVTSALADWPVLGTSDWGKWYYQIGPSGTSKNGVAYQAIVCEIYLTDAGRAGFNTTAYAAKVIYFIDCAGNRFATTALAFFDRAGNRMGDIQEYETFDWVPINPGSIAEQMRKVCCGGIRF